MSAIDAVHDGDGAASRLGWSHHRQQAGAPWRPRGWLGLLSRPVTQGLSPRDGALGYILPGLRPLAM